MFACQRPTERRFNRVVLDRIPDKHQRRRSQSDNKRTLGRTSKRPPAPAPALINRTGLFAQRATNVNRPGRACVCVCLCRSSTKEFPFAYMLEAEVQHTHNKKRIIHTEHLFILVSARARRVDVDVGPRVYMTAEQRVCMSSIIGMSNNECVCPSVTGGVGNRPACMRANDARTHHTKMRICACSHALNDVYEGGFSCR